VKSTVKRLCYGLAFAIALTGSATVYGTMVWGSCPSSTGYFSEVCPDEYDINTCGVGEHPSGDLDECSCSNHGGTWADGVCEG